MKRTLSRMISVVLTLAMVISMLALPASALSWDNVSETRYASRYQTSDYATGKFYKNLTQIPLTGDGRRDVVAVAASQMGYIEGSNANGYDGETGGSSNYTEYGYFLGLTGGSSHAWCAAFCAWSFYAAEVTDVDGYYYDTNSGNIWADTYVPDWSNYLIDQGRYKAAYQFRNSYSSLYDASYVPQPGDLVFFYTASGDYPGWEGHIGLVAYSDGTYVYTLEGNTSSQDGVESEGGGAFFKKYSLTGSNLVGFGSMPYESVAGLPEIDYTGANPTPGLYVTTSGAKSVYQNINDSTASWTLPMSSVFEVLEVATASDGTVMLYSKCVINGSTVYGWIAHGSDYNGYTKTLQIYASGEAYEDPNDADHDGIPDSYGVSVDEEGTYSLDNSYGFTFKINDTNGTIDGEDATLITTASAYNSCNPNWAISVQLRPSGNDNEYSVVKVVECPGSPSAAGITLENGDLILVVHSAASYPGAYANWLSKIAAVALNEGDILTFNSSNTTATVSAGEAVEPTEPEVTEPEVTEPEVTEPEVTEPEVTEPEVTEPEVTEPEVTEPEVTEPEVTEPEVTEPEVTEPADPDADGDGILDCYGVYVEDGIYAFSNSYGYVFDIDDVNGTIDGEDATIITSSSKYSSCNPNWAISVHLRLTGTSADEYYVVKVVECPGSASAAGITLQSGDVILVVHSAASYPGIYENWMDKIAAVALKEGDIIEIASNNKTATVIGPAEAEEPTEPEVTEPEVTEPEVTEPEVTEPEVTEPEVTEPEVTEPEVTEPADPDADGDGILDCYGVYVDDGIYAFTNSYGYVFDIDDVNGAIEGEDATIITTSTAFKSCNPNWAISVQLRPTGNNGEYQVVKVVECPGSAAAAGISLASGDIIMVVHSAASYPGDYANWMDKIAAVALKKGDYVAVASDNSTVTVIREGVLEETEDDTPVIDIPDYGGAIPGAGLQGYASNLYYGCDVSFYNVNDTDYRDYITNDDSGADYSLVDFQRMKADGCDFVILRMGSSDSSGYYTDPHFFTYYNLARQAGMDIGLYFYSYALTEAEAIEEAEYVISVLDANDMYFEYPIYIDIEESDQLALSQTALSNVCYGWCETMYEAGYFPGIYGNYNLYDAISSQVKADYDFWLAYVTSATSASTYNPSNMNVSNECSMWQYSFYGYEYDGIGLDMLDVNVSYKDYPAIMAACGYNNMG